MKRKTKKIVDISIIVPVYNELVNLQRLIERLEDSLFATGKIYEIIFIDDNSSDGTSDFLKRFGKSDRVRAFQKEGKRGKAYSLIEGFERARGSIIGMIDGDLQYAPEAIPSMLEKLINADIVVANRKIYKDSLFRKITNKGFRIIFGKTLFNLPFDIQSGLKIFKRKVIQTIPVFPRTQWTFDLEFLHRASEAGFRIVEVDIDFYPRAKGSSKVNGVKTILDIGLDAVLLRLKGIQPEHIKSDSKNSMLGAGVGYRKRHYITHTTLPHKISALRTFSTAQKVFIFMLFSLIIAGLFVNPLLTIQIVVAGLSFIYFLDVLFNLFVVIKSLNFPSEIRASDSELSQLKDKDLPVYTILCPLYREVHILPQFIDAISQLDYPKQKLDVLLLLEEDDLTTIETAKAMSLPDYVRVVVVPNSQPKTKPKACNYGLGMARGEYLVIYDAEDMPDQKQLKKAYIGFLKVDPSVICLQAKLNYYNPHQNLLTRFFTAEYSLWFDITLTGLQSIGTAIPLGGTSNHFRVKDLKRLAGWDPFNVTEDADLGIRLFKQGYKTAIIDSVTLEEANSDWKNWIRQRSRWIKGYMQTYLVHTRDNGYFLRTSGIHSIFFHLIVGGKIAFILINPILWILTISYFALYAYVGPAIESVYPAGVFYMAATSLVAGNFLFVYYYMIGCAKRSQWSLIKYVFVIPIYWIMISFAGLIALYQLIFRPHFWEKTIHGLHLKKISDPIRSTAEVISRVGIDTQPGWSLPNPLSQVKSIGSLKNVFSGGFLVFATVCANFLNFIFNAYLGRVLTFSEFGLLSLFSGFLYLALIPFGSLISTVNFRAGFLDGRYGGASAHHFWRHIRFYSLIFSVIVSVVWIAAAFQSSTFFKTSDLFPFLIFTLIWVVGFPGSVDKGYLSARLMFGSLGVILLSEAVIKLSVSYLLVSLHLSSYVYLSIPASVLVSFLVGWIFVLRERNHIKNDDFEESVSSYFPLKFFVVSLLSTVSVIAFLTVDIILAKHFLSPTQAGEYALVSLVGKMIFFLGSLSLQFITPLVARAEWERKNTLKIFYSILFTTIILTSIGFVSFGVYGHTTIPYLFGEKSIIILEHVVWICLAMVFFTLSRVFVSYYLTRKIYTFPIVSFCLAAVQVFLISVYHDSVGSIVLVMLLIAQMNLFLMLLLHIGINKVIIFENALADLFGIFQAGYAIPSQISKQPRILIYNWRDISHKWAGGAELYLHSLAKRWVKEGCEVTLFCGNDGHHSRNANIDGVQIVRRGGFYMVYFWAIVYYIVRFRGKFDVVIDSENGIPFFTPLFVGKPKILLVYHIHQDVFQKHLFLPFALFAMFLEKRVMPMLYRNESVVTISESSKKEILNLGLGKNGIDVINPGIDSSLYARGSKTSYPSFAYLGRLKPYKNVDTAIKAFARISAVFSDARLLIGGEGESGSALRRLSIHLNIDDKVTFLGKISEEAKADILSQSWVALQPSQVEGWGITVIEANASGTPVIASNVNGLKDSVVHGKTGLLVKARSVDELARAMIELLLNNDLRNMLSTESVSWASQFSWDTSAELFYKAILRRLENYRGAKSIPMSFAKAK